MMPEVPEFVPSYHVPGISTIDTGGTWAREAALAAAARVRSGDAQQFCKASEVTDMADAFVAWLNEKPEPDNSRDLLNAAVGASPEKFTAFLDRLLHILREDTTLSTAEQAMIGQTAATAFRETFGAPQPGGYEDGYRDGQNSAADDWQRVLDQASEIAEVELRADLTQLINGQQFNITAIALAMSRRGWVRIE